MTRRVVSLERLVFLEFSDPINKKATHTRLEKSSVKIKEPASPNCSKHCSAAKLVTAHTRTAK
jgi:hypothetical protein